MRIALTTMPAKSSKKTYTNREYQKLRKATVALAKCVSFALRFDKHLGRGTGMMVDLNTKPYKTLGPWQEQFFDALDMVGICYDRQAYYRQKSHTRRSR